MALFLIQHSREKGFEGPEMSQCVDTKCSDVKAENLVAKEYTESSLYDIFWYQVEEQFSLDDTSIVDKDSGMSYLNATVSTGCSVIEK
jgi:hypothetical protein